MVSQFWTTSLRQHILIPNNVSQARDFHMSERNFMSAIKAALAVILAGGVFFSHAESPSRADWILGIILLVIATLLPITALVNYASDVEDYRTERGDVHADKPFMLVVVLACAATIAVNVVQYIES